MTYLIIGAVAFFATCIVVAIYRSHYGIGDAKVRFQTEAGSTIRSGHGRSLGEAVANGIGNLYRSLSESSRLDTIESRLITMQTALAENKGRMFARDIAVCESYIAQTRKLYDRKKAEEAAKEKAKADAIHRAREKAEEKRRLQREKEKENARLRAERERKLPEQRRFVAEQRRLMTDSLRYDVMRRDGFRCQICGATAADGYRLHVDHILPVSKGGKTELSNLRTLCERCNMGKRDKIENIPEEMTPEEFAEMVK